MHIQSIAISLLAIATSASAGVLIDYGYDAAALNDAGVVRSEDNPNSQFGFAQFQAFNIDFADEAWQLDSALIGVRAWDIISTGQATLAIYGSNGLQPDLLDKRSADFSFTASSLFGELVQIDLGGIVLESGFYYVGIEAAEPTAELLWLAGDDSAFRTARRSDGNFFSGSPRALSLSLSGAVVPGPGGLVGILVFGLIGVRRRKLTA